MARSLLVAVLSARALLPFAMNSFAADPEIRIEDAYKWLFQAANGGEHAIPDEESARRWLEREWETLGPTPPGEPLEVAIRPDSELVRVNLRPLRDRGGMPEELLRAFLRGARAFEPDPELFRASWAALGEELSARPLGPLNGAEWGRLDTAMRAKGYPALEHSRAYAAARHPAYRVLTGTEATRLLETLPVVRLSLAGFRPADPKGAVVLSPGKLRGAFRVVEEGTGKILLEKKLPKDAPRGWGPFPFVYPLDFTECSGEGRYRVVVARSPAASASFRIARDAFSEGPDVLLEFLRQQRCGYNPFLDALCHPFDGRTAYGPLPAGSYLDARGGWHDAGDQLKYLLTSSTATAHLLMSWLVNPRVFHDAVDALGRPGANGIPDVLDEAKWGLDWLLRLHPSPGTLCHQVADDRDHRGWRLPQKDDADYGWGPGRERTVYFADGKPQGLGKYQSASNGVANLAGRYAAAMALAYRVFRDDAHLAAFARDCLTAGREVYALGKANEGVQQGNSYGAPYRYAEETWADDMEWGAAELYRATGEEGYLADAERYAPLAGPVSWMGRESAGHYQYYPFVNLGHFALAEAEGPRPRPELAAWYREGLEKALAVSEKSPFGVGVPFLWCSNNLAAALVTQGLLYERMTGDRRFRGLVAAQLDWLLGRNPWGVSMFTGWPPDGPFPEQPHLPTTNLTGRPVRGGLVDGPVAASIFRSLKGVTLTRPDRFAPFQSEEAVWHDDPMEYATNEPTMDGTAAAVLMLALRTAP